MGLVFEILNVETGRKDDKNSFEVGRGKYKLVLKTAPGKDPI
jgi:hypothetical protein